MFLIYKGNTVHIPYAFFSYSVTHRSILFFLIFSQCNKIQQERERERERKEKKKQQQNQRTAEAHVTGRNTETQMMLHTRIKSGVGQNFCFSELCGFWNCA
jgi:hypothetical protein